MDKIISKTLANYFKKDYNITESHKRVYFTLRGSGNSLIIL